MTVEWMIVYITLVFTISLTAIIVLLYQQVMFDRWVVRQLKEKDGVRYEEHKKDWRFWRK